MTELISKLANGNNRAFKKIHRLYYPRLIRYARYMLKNDQEAEDLVQDVFFQIWEQRRSLKNNQNLGAYLFTLVKNKSLNILKHKIIEEKYVLQHKKDFSEELYHISFQPDVDFVSSRDNLFNELKKIIDQMPDRCGEAFKMKWLEGKKHKEIAEKMNISLTMVDKHLSKGFKIAREKIKRNIIFFLTVTKFRK